MTSKDAVSNLMIIRAAFVEAVTAEQARIIDDTFDMAVKALEQKELKIGHWIADSDSWFDIFPAVNGYRCSECNTLNIDESSYCPNCGIKMEEEE